MGPAGDRLTFQALLERLRARVSQRIAEGEVTERGLALRAGISQSHLHNVLKGVRSMTPAIADLLMATLELSFAELADSKPRADGGRPPRSRMPAR